MSDMRYGLLLLLASLALPLAVTAQAPAWPPSMPFTLIEPLGGPMKIIWDPVDCGGCDAWYIGSPGLSLDAGEEVPGLCVCDSTVSPQTCETVIISRCTYTLSITLTLPPNSVGCLKNALGCVIDAEFSPHPTNPRTVTLTAEIAQGCGNTTTLTVEVHPGVSCDNDALQTYTVTAGCLACTGDCPD